MAFVFFFFFSSHLVMFYYYVLYDAVVVVVAATVYATNNMTVAYVGTVATETAAHATRLGLSRNTMRENKNYHHPCLGLVLIKFMQYSCLNNTTTTQRTNE